MILAHRKIAKKKILLAREKSNELKELKLQFGHGPSKSHVNIKKRKARNGGEKEDRNNEQEWESNKCNSLFFHINEQKI